MWKSLCFWCSLHLVLIYTVDGVKLSITPQPSVTPSRVTGPSDTTRTFACGNIIGNPPVQSISAFRISRMTKHEQKDSTITDPVTIAIVIQDQGVQRPDVPDIQNRNRVPDDGITGSVNKVDFGQSYISIKFNTVGMQCDDEGQYFCQLSYLDRQYNTYTEEDSMNFTVSALPEGTSLTAKPDIRRTGDGSQNYPFEMQEGEGIELTCNGRIGSDTTTQLEWKKTGATGSLIKFPISPFNNNANETKEPVVPLDDQCTNSRTTKLRYTITNNDKHSRGGKLEFQCYIESQGVTVNSSIIYIAVEGGVDNSEETGGSTNPETSNAGVIAGAVVGAIVFIVIVVLLIYFLWYRRRGGGDTYKTREETDGSNPNLAPSAADLYARPHTDRNTEAPKPKPRAKKGKELHYAELDIATNVPMVAPRRSNERVEYAEVKFNNNHDYEHPV